MASRHGIWLAHGLAGSVDDLEVVVGEEFGPSRLSPVEDLGRGEVLEVPVVGVDGEGMRRALEVGAPLLDGHDDGEHLLVVDLVVELWGRELAGVERDRMENAESSGWERTAAMAVDL